MIAIVFYNEAVATKMIEAAFTSQFLICQEYDGIWTKRRAQSLSPLSLLSCRQTPQANRGERLAGSGCRSFGASEL